MKIEDYKLGQKVSLYGRIEAIDIENIHDKENTTTLKINTFTKNVNQPCRTISVNPKCEEVTIEPDKQKPVVPKFVAEWYEENKDDSEDFIFDLVEKMSIGWFLGNFDDWSRDAKNKPIQTLINMHQFGYTVEKEKLYTVEIPNPNSGMSYIFLTKRVSGVSIDMIDNVRWKADKRNQLTESEIKQDFEWAFRWAKEVTE